MDEKVVKLIEAVEKIVYLYHEAKSINMVIPPIIDLAVKKLEEELANVKSS